MQTLWLLVQNFEYALLLFWPFWGLFSVLNFFYKTSNLKWSRIASSLIVYCLLKVPLQLKHYHTWHCSIPGHHNIGSMYTTFLFILSLIWNCHSRTLVDRLNNNVEKTHNFPCLILKFRSIIHFTKKLQTSTLWSHSTFSITPILVNKVHIFFLIRRFDKCNSVITFSPGFLFPYEEQYKNNEYRYKNNKCSE